MSMITSQPDPGSPIRDLFDQPVGGPTVVRILLGAQLRRLREAGGVTREAAGHAIGLAVDEFNTARRATRVPAACVQLVDSQIVF